MSCLCGSWKERFERCVSTPELHAAHPCPLKRMPWLLGPCHLVNRVNLWACMLPEKACGQLVVGRRVDLKMPTVTVQYSSLGVNATVHIGSRALPSVWNFYRNTVEARPWPHVFTIVLPVCIASFVAGLVHSTVASDGPSAQPKEQPKQHRLVSRSPHTSCQGVLA